MAEKPSAQAGRPRDKQLAKRRRTEILAHATRVFAERSYRHTDVEMIAAAAGVSKGTVYRYFPTKEDLFLSTVDDAMQRLQARVDAAMRNAGDFDQGISHPTYVGIEAHLSFFNENPEVVELLIQERAEFKDRAEPSFQVYLQRNRPAWKSMGDELRRQGRLRDIGSDAIHDFMVQLIYGTMFINYFRGSQTGIQEQARRMTDIVLWGILSETERAATAPATEDKD